MSKSPSPASAKRKERSFETAKRASAIKKPKRKTPGAIVASEPYYNTVPCQEPLRSKGNAPCKHMAYFALPSGKYVCGQHSLQMKDVRKKLVKDPNARSQRIANLEAHEKSVEDRASKNAESGVRGSVECFHMTMMGSVPLKKGVRNVFPNNKHGGRKDGFGCPSLSPMRLGPVDHRQPGLPQAKNVENYHQFNKVWPCEVDEDGDLSPEFAERRSQGYKDPEPHRHKFDAATMKRMREEVGGQNGNQPLYSVHLDKEGNERRFTYVQSRYFYCCAYEKLAKETNSFEALLVMLENGYDLMICGYDAYPVTKDLYAHYCDPTKPFGHEMVLYSLLTLGEHGSGGAYPWHVYRKNHPKVYENIARVKIPGFDSSDNSDESSSEGDAGRSEEEETMRRYVLEKWKNCGKLRKKIDCREAEYFYYRTFDPPSPVSRDVFRDFVNDVSCWCGKCKD
jgi:hypothetical protein